MLVEGVMKRELRALRIASLVATLLAAEALVGCAARIHVPFVPGDALAGPTLARSAPSEFEYINSLPHPASVITAEDAAYRTVSLAFSSAGENGQAGNLVTARYYRSKSKGAKPLVIVLPIWGIETYPSNTISAGLRKHGAGTINVLQIDGERPLLDWDAVGDTRTEGEFLKLLDQMIGRFVSTVIDIRRVVDWAQTQPDVDPQRIALIGFSMGALVASVAMANEPRLAAGVLVMGGADPDDILAACSNEIGRGRGHLLEHLDWSLDEFRHALAKPLARINPARFAGMVDPRKVLIIEAAADTCIPPAARERLWQAMGRPERLAYLYDHRTAFLAMTFLGGNNLQQQIYRFLDSRFPDAPRGGTLPEHMVQDVG
ncbi:MAG TPA: dienelactone hydrolase family protein [Geminicoccaceae bacterium]|nr:dienelactone hydrolase family protein [Geminicoccaceae bacterium]